MGAGARIRSASRGIVKDEEGQAIIEYVLMLLIAIAVVGTLAFGFRRIVLSLWQTMACEIAAACPACPPPEEVLNKIASSCRSN